MLRNGRYAKFGTSRPFATLLPGNKPRWKNITYPPGDCIYELSKEWSFQDYGAFCCTRRYIWQIRVGVVKWTSAAVLLHVCLFWSFRHGCYLHHLYYLNIQPELRNTVGSIVQFIGVVSLIYMLGSLIRVILFFICLHSGLRSASSSCGRISDLTSIQTVFTSPRRLGCNNGPKSARYCDPSRWVSEYFSSSFHP